MPVLVGSLADFTFLLKRKTTVREVNMVLKKASKHPFYRGIVGVTEDSIVSSDIVGSSLSSLVDLGMTQVIDGDFVKIISWYDNEWGYCNRLVEMAIEVGKLCRTYAPIFSSKCSNDRYSHAHQ